MFFPRTRNLVKIIVRSASNGLSPDLVQALKKELPEFPLPVLRAMERPFLDKSGTFLWLLASQGITYSLHRPTRMGKTMNVSMLAHYHLDPMLFDDLKLGKLLQIEETKWKSLQEKQKKEQLSNAEKEFLTIYTPLQFRKQHPVLYFNLKTLSNEEKSSSYLAAGFQARCRMYAQQIFGLGCDESKLSTSFRTLLADIKEKTGLLPVVFIDDYDSPVWFNGDPAQDQHYDENRSVLRKIFRGLKDTTVQFGFLTGITPANKLVLASTGSFVKDVSYDPKYEEMCGFTREEVKTAFGEKMKTIAKKENLSEKEFLDKLTLFYGGQSFSPAIQSVFNPDSVQKFFDHGEFGLHTTDTGDSKYVQWAIKQYPSLVFKPSHSYTWTEDPDLKRDSFLAVLKSLWHLGYFSPKRVDSTMTPYLRVFNIEIGARLKLLLQAASYPGTLLSVLDQAFDNTPTDIPLIMTCLNQALWELSLHSEKELAYKVAIDALLYRADVLQEGEPHVGPGRADLVIYAKNLNLILELEIHHEADEVRANAERGMAQLKQHRFHTRFLRTESKKDVYFLAMSIDPINRLINEFTYARVISQGKEVVEEEKFVDMRPVIADMKSSTRSQKKETITEKVEDAIFDKETWSLPHDEDEESRRNRKS